MVKILLSGCNGKMGKVITELIDQRDDLCILAGIDVNTKINADFPVYQDINQFDQTADVVIDFSHPSALSSILAYCEKTKTPLVMATTGLSEQQIESLNQSAKNTPIFFSANMSLGVNLLIELAKTAAKFLEGSFDIEILEKHHNQKIDAPSGTAVVLANEINDALSEKKSYVYDRHEVREKRKQNEIGINAIRGGTITGEHTVIFAGNHEILELTHKATNRDIFATGALNAALFMKNKPVGMYKMKDMIKALAE